MKQVGWMVLATVPSWLCITGLTGERTHPELLYGMLGPLAVASVSWVAMERTYTSSPERLTGLMLKGLLVKAVFFGTYVAGMLRVFGVRPVPFMLAFTGYFVGLHVMEAVFMRRLFAHSEARSGC